MIKVSMNLTELDVQNADEIYERLGSRSKAQAVATALSLTRFLVDQIFSHGAEICLRHSNGELQRIVMPELQNIEVVRRKEKTEKKKGAAAKQKPQISA